MARLATTPFFSCALKYLELHGVHLYLAGGKGTRAAWRAIEAHFAAIRRFRGDSVKLDLRVASDVVLATGPVVLAAAVGPGHSAMLPGNSADNSATGCNGATVVASRLLNKCDSNASSALTSDSDDDAPAEGPASAAAALSADRDIFAEDPERTAAFPLSCRVPAEVHTAATELMLELMQPAPIMHYSEECAEMLDYHAETRANLPKRAFIKKMHSLTGGGPVEPMKQIVGFTVTAAAQ